MALRLRRGTNAERQLITPLSGELIYTTDTKALYIGDGTTAGGVVVQGGGGGAGGLNDLSDVTIGSITNGQVLAYESSSSQWKPVNQGSVSFGALNQHTDVFYPNNGHSNGDILLSDGTNWVASQLQDSQFKLTIVGSDSSILLDHTSQRLNANVTGDLIKADGGIVLDTSTQTANGLTLKANNNTTAYDPAARKFYGDLHGNHQGDIYSATSSGTVKLLDHNTGLFFGDIAGGDIYNSDSSILLSSHTSTLYGDVNGSIFANDSSQVVDGITGKIVGSIQTTQSAQFDGTIEIAKNVASDPVVNYVSTNIGSFPGSTYRVSNHANSNIANEITFFKTRGTPTTQTTVQAADGMGGVAWSAYDGSAVAVGTAITSKTDAISSLNHTASIDFKTRNGLIATYGVKASISGPGVLSVDSVSSITTNANFTVGANGTGHVVMSRPMRLASFTTTQRNALTAANGDMIYNTTDNKIQGYENGAWANLI
jgi:hypothetical protein